MALKGSKVNIEVIQVIYIKMLNLTHLCKVLFIWHYFCYFAYLMLTASEILSRTLQDSWRFQLT